MGFLLLCFFFVFILSFDESLLVLLAVVYELRDVLPEVLELFEVLRDLEVDEFLLLLLDSRFFDFDLDVSMLD